jgi:hypothetical protein
MLLPSHKEYFPNQKLSLHSALLLTSTHWVVVSFANIPVHIIYCNATAVPAESAKCQTQYFPANHLLSYLNFFVELL